MLRLSMCLSVWCAFIVLAPASQAQLPNFGVAGTWDINIPAEPYGPAEWEFSESQGIISGETSFEVEGLEVNGELTGRKLFFIVYQLDSTFSLAEQLPGYEGVQLQSRAYVVMLLGQARGIGFTIDLQNDIPVPRVYAVSGSKN